MGCTKGSPVRWRDFYEVGVALDNVAASLDNPVYTPTSLLHHTPWPLADIVRAAFYERFEVSVNDAESACSSVVITKRLMAYANGDTYALPDTALNDLADENELFFMSDQTNCWCKSVFQVEEGEASSYTLSTGAADGCCQNMPVPDVGDTLCYNQHFIPAAYVKDWATIDAPGEAGPFTRRVPACRGGGDDILLFFEPAPSDEHPNRFVLVAAQRWITGYFTWHIREQWLAYIDSGIQILNFCEWTGGAKAKSIYAVGTTTYRDPGCPVSDLDFFWSGLKLWGNNAQPGCLAGRGDDFCFPWSSLCCNARECDGIQVYCNTLEQLLQIISHIEGVLPRMIEADLDNTNCQNCCNPTCAFSPVLPTLEESLGNGPGDYSYEMLNNSKVAECGARYSSPGFPVTYTVNLEVTLVVVGDEGDSGSVTINGEAHSVSVPPESASGSITFDVDITTLFADTLAVQVAGLGTAWTGVCTIDVSIDEPEGEEEEEAPAESGDDEPEEGPAGPDEDDDGEANDPPPPTSPNDD